MNFRDLNEDVGNFADQAEQTLKGVGDLAKSAFGKFKAAKGKAEADIEGDQKKAAGDKEKTDKDAAAAQKGALLAKAGPKTAPITVAGILLDRTPEEGDLPELEDLDAEHFGYVQNALEQINSRFDKFTKHLIKTFRTAPFINANDRREIPDRLGDQDDRMLDGSETMLMADNYGERDAWMQALTNDDPTIGAKALLASLGKIATAHAKLNLALMSKGDAKKVYAEGLNLINMIGGQRQLIEMRIGLMRNALAKLSQKPVTEALLRRTGKLAKRM